MKQQVIIIPVHNQLPFLERCVKSVFENTKLPIIIIIDDGSDKETADYIWELDQFENIVTIRNEKALGFTGACNKGIDYAMDHYDFKCLCLLNSDAQIITKDWFDKVEYFFEESSKIGVAGVVSDNAMSQTITNKNYLTIIDKKPTIYCHIVHGFCYFISKTLIETIGHMDDITFPHYGSEDDYSLKSVSNGFQNIIVGSVLVNHNNETSYGKEVRTNYIKYSMPNFLKRWGRAFVDSCIKQHINAGKYLNEWVE